MMMQLSASPSRGEHRLQRIGVHFKKRQLLADLLRLIEHQMHVFQVLLHVACARNRR